MTNDERIFNSTFSNDYSIKSFFEIFSCLNKINEKCKNHVDYFNLNQIPNKKIKISIIFNNLTDNKINDIIKIIERCKSKEIKQTTIIERKYNYIIAAERPKGASSNIIRV